MNLNKKAAAIAAMKTALLIAVGLGVTTLIILGYAWILALIGTPAAIWYYAREVYRDEMNKLTIKELEK